MTRVHDMGGRFGDGPLVPEPQGAVPFAAEWHGKTVALDLAANGLGAWTYDAMRHARESLSPKDYARFSYYEKWIAALADILVAEGLVTEAELASGTADQTAPHPMRVSAEAMVPRLKSGARSDRPGAAPAFAVGDRVRTRLPARNAFVPGGHTRLPAYAAGQVGRIVLSHGCHVFPDANAHGFGEQPEPLYTVVFDATDLWGQAEAPGDEVTLDLWESYLARA